MIICKKLIESANGFESDLGFQTLSNTLKGRPRENRGQSTNGHWLRVHMPHMQVGVTQESEGNAWDGQETRSP